MPHETEPFADEVQQEPRKSIEEDAPWYSRMTFSYMYPLLRRGIDEIITEKDLSDCHPRDKAAMRFDELRQEWAARTAQMDQNTYLTVMKRLESYPTRGLISDPSVWQPLRARVEAGEFRCHTDSQFFYEAVEGIIRTAYKSMAPSCPLCAINKCPYPKGAPKLPGLPAPEKVHLEMGHVVDDMLRVARSGEPSLMKTVLYLQRYDILVAAIWGAAQSLSVFVSIYLLPEIIKVLSRPVALGEEEASPSSSHYYATYEGEPLWKGFMWSGVVLVCTLFMAFGMGQQYAGCVRISNHTRAMLAAAIHQKSMRLSTNGWQAMGGHGKIFNLLNTDTETIFQRAYSVAGQIMFFPAQIIIALAFLGYLLTWPVLVGVVVMAGCFRYNYLLGLDMMDCFVMRMIKSDSRVKKQHELLENIRAVKYFAWEDHYFNEINRERSEEVKSVKRLLVSIAKMMFASNLGPYAFQGVILVVTAAWDESILTTTTIFQTVALTALLRLSFSLAPMLYSQYFTIESAFYRIQDFLMKHERDTNPFRGTPGEIVVRDASFAWKRTEPVLKGLSMCIKPGELVMVVGRVGSGKSSLLEGLLGGMNVCPSHDGANPQLSVGGRVAYCPQTAWVFNATLKENILWRRKDHGKRYDRVVRAAELLDDLHSLPNGDNTEIGEKGINLSGGQKARVSLARAVYTDADVYLLDDPLSAVDAYVGKKLFDNVICGLMKGRTRVLVTNQMQYVQHADRVFSATPDGYLREEDLSVAFAPPADPKHLTVLQELLVEFQNKSASEATILGEAVLSLAAAVASVIAVQGPPLLSDFPTAPSNESFERAPSDQGVVPRDLVEEEVVEIGDVTFATYKHYLGYYGGAGYWTFLLTVQLLAFSVERMSFIWLGWYADEGREQSVGWYTGEILSGDHHTGFWLGVYMAFLLATSILVGVREVMFARKAQNPSRKMCDDHVRAIVNSPVRFFDTTPSGRILTRFTFDWMAIDMQVPMMLGFTMTQFAQLAANVLFITISVPWFAIGYPFLWLAYWYVTRTDRTALQLRRIFNKTKSPVTDTFASTLHGLATIHAFGREEDMINEEYAVIDANTAAFSAERLGFEWVRLRVNLVGAILTGALYLMVILFRDHLTPATVGLMVAQGTSFTTVIGLAFLTRQQLEMAMNSIERILEHCRLPPEESDEERQAALPDPPRGQWPHSGEIIISSLSIRYRPNLPLVLRDVNLRIEGGWRVGICGRTGGGKSTILKALFRLMRPEPGYSIIIDGVHTERLKLKTLRQSMAIIPQEPVVLEGSVRYNLDPFDEVRCDEKYWDALRGCHLEATVRERAAAQNVADPLEMKITSENLSVGQRQLLCLGRALVLGRKILLLDEATANVDVMTDALIQQTLRSKFAGVTQLIIAHRLNTIVDCDRILVVAPSEGGGRVVQYDTYENLISDHNGVFRALAEEAGLVPREAL